MSDDRRSLGAEGENQAARYLIDKRYRITARNVRAGGVEIDLIAQKAGTLVFVEVKTRRSNRFGVPQSAVDAPKRARLVRGAAAWLRDNRVWSRRIRFDVITCRPPGATLTTMSSGSWKIEHIEGAFDAGD